MGVPANAQTVPGQPRSAFDPKNAERQNRIWSASRIRMGHPRQGQGFSPWRLWNLLRADGNLHDLQRAGEHWRDGWSVPSVLEPDGGDCSDFPEYAGNPAFESHCGDSVLPKWIQAATNSSGGPNLRARDCQEHGY